MLDIHRSRRIEHCLLRTVVQCQDHLGYHATLSSLANGFQADIPNIENRELVEALKRLQPKYLTLCKYVSGGAPCVVYPTQFADDEIFFWRGDGFRMRRTPETAPRSEELGAILEEVGLGYGGQTRAMENVDELSSEIMQYLLADFLGRSLTSDHLSDGYEGPRISAMKEHFSAKGAGAVDFDLAMKDLENSGLIDTGPMVPFDNPPHSRVLVLGLWTKREYVYLTEKGYKAAKKRRPREKSRGTTNVNVNISGGHFHQSPMALGEHVNQSVTASSGSNSVFGDLNRVVRESDFHESDRQKLIASIAAMEAAQFTPSFRDRYRDFIALAADYMTLIGPYVPALAALVGKLSS